MSAQSPIVSVVFATHNRRAILERTLSKLNDCGLNRGDFETIVVDNNSTDGTPQMVGSCVDRLIHLSRNFGSTGKAYGADVARGRYIVFLDDDSFPRPGSLERMIHRFENDPELGAAGFTVHQTPARPAPYIMDGLFSRCGVGLRAEAHAQVGGLDRTFYMQAEEYDLSFRLVSAGWDVKVFPDLHVEHQGANQPPSESTLYYDARNSLRVLARYLPSPFASIYRIDFLQRHGWLAQTGGESHLQAFSKGRRAGDLRSILERPLYQRNRLSEAAFERFFRWSQIRTLMTQLWQAGVNRILLAPLGENTFPFHVAARNLGLQIVAIADDRFAAPNRDYRGTPILTVARAVQTLFDAVVISTTCPREADDAAALLALKTSMPVNCWFAESSDPKAPAACADALSVLGGRN